jgi:hypothetical protein
MVSILLNPKGIISIMRIDHNIGVYPEHYASVLRWYNLAFKGIHPSKEDEKTYQLFNIIYEDIIRESYEEYESHEE